MRMQRFFVSLVVLGAVMAWAGAASAASNVVLGPPTSNPFPAQLVGSTSAAATFELVNNATGGGNDTQIDSWTPTGTHCSDFAVTTTLPILMPADGGATKKGVDVTFNPGARGARGTCTFTAVFEPTSPNPTVVAFTVTGTGVAPVLQLSTTTRAFNDVRVGTPSQLTFRVTNASNDTGQNLIFTASEASTQYTISHTAEQTIAPLLFVDITVTFTPTSTGAHNATVTFVENDPVGSAFVVNLSGNGVQSVISAAPNPLDIGNASVDGPQVNGNVVVDNTGGANLNITDMTITGADATDFRFVSHGCTGQTCGTDFTVLVTPSTDTETVTIGCLPDATGPKNAILTFIGDQGAGSSTVDLDCNGTAPNIVLSNATRAFGSVVVGTAPSPTLQFTIQNSASGSETLDYTITETGDTSNVFSLSPACSSNCTTNAETDTFTVTFAPTAQQAYTATLTINHDDPDAGVVTVALSGTGIAPVISNPVPGLTVTLPNTDVGVTSTPATNITITNSGDALLTVNSVAFVGGNFTEFAFTSTNQGMHTVGIGLTDSWTVTCTPTARGLRTTTMRITSNAINDATFDFTLNCTGLEAVFSFTPAGGLNFGQVVVGTPDGGATGCAGGTACSVVVSNTGNKPGTINSISTTDGMYAATVVGGAPPRVVTNGSSVTIDVVFTPTNGASTTRALLINTANTPAQLSVPLNGDGVTPGVDITVSGDPDLVVDLGDLRVGTTTPRLVTINNSDDTAYTLSLPTSNDSHCVIAPVSPAAGAYPFILAGGASATFNVNATPTVVGAESCTINIVSNKPPTGTSDDVIFNFRGVAPGVLIAQPSGGTLAFGGLDVDAAAVQLPVEISNPGTFLLTIASCTITGPSASLFAIPACPNVTVLPGESTTMMVSYNPLVESLDTATLTFVVDALGVPNVQVPVTGTGLDQRIDLPALAYTFPNTHRSPVTPPEIMVTVGNPVSAVTGTGAPLTVSMAVSDDAGLFVVTDAGPFTVEPGGTIGVPVEFRPVTTGIFQATLTIFNDATGMDMAEVTLNGTAIERMVGVPGLHDLGVTGVGIPVRLAEVNAAGVVVSNLDGENDYTITAIGFVDDDGDPVDGGPFTIIDDPSGQTLESTSALSFDVEFVAEAAGEFSVFIAVYLDGDPMPHGMRTELRGEAIEIEIQGGGCQTGRGSGWATLLLAGLAVLGLRRRRRAAVAGLALLVVAIGASAPARAEPTRNIEISTFVPSPATEVDGFAVESPLVGVNGAWALGLAMSHATDVLTMGDLGSDELPDPVTARTALQLGFAYAFLGRFEAGVRLPLYQQSGDPAQTMLGDGRQFTGLAPADGTALGDIALHLKAQAVDTGQFAAGASVDVTAPTATDDEFAGVDGVSGHIRGIAGLKIGRVGVTANVGFIVRGTGDLGNIRQGNSLSFGAGARFRALDKLWVVGEAFGTTGPGAAMGVETVKSGVTQLEGVAGIRYELGRTVGISVGGGRGIISGAGAPAVRAFLLIDVAPRARELPPLVIRKPPPPRDTRDDDEDGIANADDQCGKDAEDSDGYRDDDGCPEADNDEDGLLDGDDKCPIEAEDTDGTMDQDGCVDPDNDADGILDLDDKCPNEAEDKDGHLDNDGCDEPDNDADGIPDVIDQCALEAETINGNADDDGCPDNGDSLVMIMPDRIEIFEPVTFTGTTATLTKKSSNVLGQVAATLRANRDFKRVRVTVHVHPRGGGDEELSRKRAKAVRDWLVQWGIEPERVEDKGLGSSRPLVPKGQKGAAALNDRVEFIILEKEVGK